MTDSPIAHRKKAQLVKTKEEYAKLDKQPLEDKYEAIVVYLLKREWTDKKTGGGKVIAVDGTIFNEDDYALATEKMMLCELEFQKRYPLTYPAQLDWLIEKAKKSLENKT